MNSRVPDTGPEVTERNARLAHFRQRLAYFQSIPADRRDAEHADEGEHDMTALIAELEAQDVRKIHE